MTYGIFVYLLILFVFMLFVAGVTTASLKQWKFTVAFFLSCLLLPTFFIGGVYVASAVGWARYEAEGANEMRPIDDEPNGNIIVIFKETSTFEEQQELFNDVISPWKKDVGFTHETGVRATLGLFDIDGMVTQKLFFSASATEAQKEKLRMGLDASPIVYRYFENKTEAEVRNSLRPRQAPNLSDSNNR